MDDETNPLSHLDELAKKFSPTAEKIAASLPWAGNIIGGIDSLMGVKSTLATHQKKIERALTKEGVDSQRAHELAQAYRELELGKAHLREDAQRYLLSTGRGILEGLFSRKGTTTTAADFVPVIPLGPIVYTLGDIVGAARAIREINEAKAGQHSIQEGTLKLLAALIPYVPTGLAQQTLERVFEAMYVSHVLDTNPKDE